MSVKSQHTIHSTPNQEHWQDYVHILLADAELIHFSTYFNIQLLKGSVRAEDYLNIQENENSREFLTIVIKSKKTHNTYQVESIQVSSSDIPLRVKLKAQEKLFIVVISINKKNIGSLFQNEAEKTFFEKHIETNKAVFYDVIATPEIQFVLHQLSEYQPFAFLSDFYGEIKSKELLYFLFRELNQRTIANHLNLHQADIEAVFTIRDSILKDLTIAPLLADLATTVAMSETKMKMIFKQVFGASIYEYYQLERMNKAAEWLQHKSVSETGYLLGFSNLSHFSRLFAKHFNLTPKKYQASLNKG